MTSGSGFGYARAGDGAYIAYRVDGDGPIDFVHQPEWPGNIDLEWEDPWSAAWLGELSSHGRVIMHDHRGVGLSSRNVQLPMLETRVADLFSVLDTVGVTRAVMIGFLTTGAVNLMAAAMRPDLARSLIWAEPMARYAWAPDYPWGTPWEDLDAELAHLASWGTDDYSRWFLDVEAAAGNPMPDIELEAMTRQTRNACTPDVARELARIWFDTDVRGVLESVTTPTLLLVHEDRPKSLERATHVAALMPTAEVRVMPGDAWSVEEQRSWIDEILRFIGAERPAPVLDTVLSTVLFTDIVDSTAMQAHLGDRGWKELIERHHARVRAALQQWRRVEIDTAGDGFFATFEGPARAISCALEIASRVRDLGIEIRAGVHTGECQLADGKVAGLSVTIGARVAAEVAPSEVLVSQTVRDLVAGSGLTFEDAGAHVLKGVPDRWRLYRVIG